MKYKIEIDIDENKINESIMKHINANISRIAKEECEKRVKQICEEYLWLSITKQKIREIADEAVTHNTTAYVIRRLNCLFDDLLDNMNKVCLNEGVIGTFDTNTRSFFQGIYAAYLAKDELFNGLISDIYENEEFERQLKNAAIEKYLKSQAFSNLKLQLKSEIKNEAIKELDK